MKNKWMEQVKKDLIKHQETHEGQERMENRNPRRLQKKKTTEKEECNFTKTRLKYCIYLSFV